MHPMTLMPRFGSVKPWNGWRDEAVTTGIVAMSAVIW